MIEDEDQEDLETSEHRNTNTLLDIRDDLDGLMTKLFNLRGRKTSTSNTERISHTIICTFLIIVTGTAFLTAQYLEKLENLETSVIIPMAFLSFLLFFLIFCLSLQPRSKERISFRVPFVPVIPCLAVFSNIYLMMKLSVETWIRFFIWLFVGLFIYFFYGLKNSSENVSLCEESAESDGKENTNTYYGTIQSESKENENNQ